MNYKKEIEKLLQRIPQSVINGSVNKAIGYKIAAEKAQLVARKNRPSEAELLRTYQDLSAYE